ncbi:MAG: FprA family A-type flavoprotein [Candidatus Thorarchaeota archaeon]|nr:MAG: FprA family A-type flavoprotein [Candidatus Thorarchaeota archaeon]
MKSVVVVYESQFGNTEQLAKEIAAGIEKTGEIRTFLSKPKEIEPTEIHAADAILFGCPVHAGGPTRGMKKFIGKLGKEGLSGKLTACFETYMGDHKSRAVGKMEGMIAEKLSGLTLVKPGLSALVVGFRGPLADDALQKAREFGSDFGQRLLTS